VSEPVQVEHSIEVIVNVDDVQVHRVVRRLAAQGTVADALGDFNAVAAVSRVLRQEADFLLDAILREQAASNGHTVIDAKP